MGDISTWNPVDNSNTTAPPDGWPEAMPPSAVNNCARAMMGAVRRWYDTVTAQIAGMLPLTGGTLTGALTVPQLTSTGNINAAIYSVDGVPILDHGGGGDNIVYNGGGSAGAQFYATGNYYNGNSHTFRNNATTVTLATIDASGNITANSFHGIGNLASDAAVLGASVTATGTVQGAQLTSTGNINAAGTVTGTSFIGSVSVPPGGSITLPPGGTLAVTGNINASSDLIAGNNIFAGNKIFTQHLEVDQDAFIGVLTIDNGLQVSNGVCYNQSGSWVSLSDATLKDDIAPYRRGLEAVLALNPVSFRYRPEVFGDDSAKITHFGLVADEVAPLVPEMVGETMHGDRAVSTLTPGHLVWCLINAAKDLAAQNAALSARITALEGNHV